MGMSGRRAFLWWYSVTVYDSSPMPAWESCLLRYCGYMSCQILYNCGKGRHYYSQGDGALCCGEALTGRRAGKRLPSPYSMWGKGEYYRQTGRYCSGCEPQYPALEAGNRHGHLICVTFPVATQAKLTMVESCGVFIQWAGGSCYWSRC